MLLGLYADLSAPQIDNDLFGDIFWRCGRDINFEGVEALQPEYLAFLRFRQGGLWIDLLDPFGQRLTRSRSVW